MVPNESSNGAVPPALARRGSVSIKDLEASLPSPEQVAQQAAALRAASVEAIKVDDVNEMMAAVLAQAKKGDVKSVRLVLDHLNSHKPERPRGPAPAPQPPAPAPIQLRPVDPEPPRPVAIDGPSADQQRLLVAMCLLNHQPMLVGGLAKVTKVAPEQLDALLAHEWFDRREREVRLTPAGRNAVG